VALVLSLQLAAGLLFCAPTAQAQPTADAAPGAAPTDAAPTDAAPTDDPAAGPPGPQYYLDEGSEPVDPAPAPARPVDPRASQPPPPILVYEPPPPMGYPVYEPPPPPKPRRVAPEYSLWLGARLGFFHPFGNAWAKCTAVDRGNFCVATENVPWHDFAGSGPMAELDVGARLGRRHVLFLAWERASLGAGDLKDDTLGAQRAGESDFMGLGLRFSSDPDAVGLLVEIVVGGRRFRTSWENGDELKLEEAPFESRIGVGADIRLSRALAISPLITLGGGQFGKATYYDKATNTESDAIDIVASHAWLTLQMGVHLDLFGSAN